MRCTLGAGPTVKRDADYHHCNGNDDDDGDDDDDDDGDGCH